MAGDLVEDGLIVFRRGFLAGKCSRYWTTRRILS
jgi:hypothetical protein